MYSHIRAIYAEEGFEFKKIRVKYDVTHLKGVDKGKERGYNN
jgi:hypothetical protein